MDRIFLFETIKKEVEFLLKKENLLEGIIFSSKMEGQSDSPFNITMEKDSMLLKIVSEEFPENPKDEKIKSQSF